MSRRETDLGDPDLRIGNLRIWIHGRQFPDSADFWDGNWLQVTAACLSTNSSVWAYGAILHLREVVAFLRASERLDQTLEGEAVLECMEPNLGAKLVARTGGHIDVVVSITPDHMSESHEFREGIDQTYLPDIIRACHRILRKIPLREADRMPS